MLKPQKTTRSASNLIVLACLPLLWETHSVENALLVGGITCLVWWMSSLFFGLTYTLFPRELLRVSVLLWVMTFAHVVWRSLGVSPLWSLSLFFLMFYEIEVLDEQLALRHRLFVRIGLWFLTILMALFREFFVRYFPMPLFETPMGLFLILASGIFFWRLHSESGASQ